MHQPEDGPLTFSNIREQNDRSTVAWRGQAKDQKSQLRDRRACCRLSAKMWRIENARASGGTDKRYGMKGVNSSRSRFLKSVISDSVLYLMQRKWGTMQALAYRCGPDPAQVVMRLSSSPAERCFAPDTKAVRGFSKYLRSEKASRPSTRSEGYKSRTTKESWPSTPAAGA